MASSHTPSSDSYLTREYLENNSFFDDAENTTAKIMRDTIACLLSTELSAASKSGRNCSFEEANTAATTDGIKHESASVETEDGAPLAVFTKDGLPLCFTEEVRHQIQGHTEDAIDTGVNARRARCAGLLVPVRFEGFGA
ncbi:hypothetical protein MMC08_007426 [Hypocenomyce scalaris]|nr:hypothetical protein [Hypocenomyce scalaris]